MESGTDMHQLEGPTPNSAEPTVRRSPARTARPRGTPGALVAAQLIALQGAAGNAAVSRHLVPRPVGTLGAGPAGRALAVQRCGPVPCDCSVSERAEYAAREADAPGADVETDPASPPVQRLAVPARTPDHPPAEPVIQRQLAPPGTCTWVQYLPLSLSVNSAKALVQMLGACRPGDTCQMLALKIAAITAEIAARVARETTCFRGGDAGHRQQITDKVNMLNNCYARFVTSNCPQALVEQMTVVVAAARAVFEAAMVMAAVAVVIAAIAALIAAIIVLAKIIAALAAAAAAAAAELAMIGAATAALLLILEGVQEQLGSGPAAEPSSA